ncbi:unnamed protein product [Bursaphelenchus okinawaensis]|uniref:Uncharacterized protein n=1 Tax=Bursaphelenchus okinawaensis TaxID=465554 RepID=A0A811JWY6_9BILA|nr:unnamed protein product [Bursaphelenchus okinawaensis]CAG9086583.1 unnamed protein product [Bursaphelenchus okinawaensis]
MASPAEIPQMQAELKWELKERFWTSDNVTVHIYYSQIDPNAVLYNIKSDTIRVLLKRTNTTASLILRDRSKNTIIHYLHAEL